MHLWSGKQSLSWSPLECSSRLWELNKCVASCSLSLGSVPGVSIPWKALQTWYPLRRSQFLQENTFFFISEKSITELDCTTRAKEPFHNQHNQEFGSLPVQLSQQMCEHTPTPLWLRSGNEILLFSQIDFSYNYCTDPNGLHLGLRGLVWLRESSLPERHCKNILHSGDSRMGMTITCFRSGEKQDMASFYKWFSIGCTSRENQDITSSYKQVRMAVTKSQVNKILEASWLLHTFTSLYGLHVQCLFAQESHPFLFLT